MSRKPERKFTKPTQISKHLYCPICIEVFFDATRLFCGHTFCKGCIDHWAKDHITCPVCRENVEPNLSSKDLIAEKIIQDLEVACPNKLCDWRDRLENLTKHLKICTLGTLPEWLQKAQSLVDVEDDPATTDIFLQDNEHFIQRINDEVPRKSFLERLYTKNLETQQLVEGVFNKEQSGGRESLPTIGILQQYDNFLLPVDDSEDEKENVECSENHKKEDSIGQRIFSSEEKNQLNQKSVLIEIGDEISQKDTCGTDEVDILSLEAMRSLSTSAKKEVNSHDVQISLSEPFNVLTEINGTVARKKRANKRKRGDETIVDNEVKCILKKTKMNGIAPDDGTTILIQKSESSCCQSK